MRRSPFLWIALLACTQACNCNGGNLAIRSGNVENDNFEEPIPSVAARFAPLLERSNDLAEMLRGGRLRDFYDSGVDAELKKSLSFEGLQNLYSQVTAHVGAPKTFLLHQWNFRGHAGADGVWVTSTKIVTHEGGDVYYAFTFANEHATRTLGLHFAQRPKKGPYHP